MKTHRSWFWLILFAAVSWFILVPVSRATSADPFLDGQIKVLDDTIRSWERNGHIVGWLIFGVFFLGLVVAAFQAATTRAMKITAAVLSFLSAVIVGYYHQFFPADDRTYDKAARQARHRLDAFTRELAQYSTLDEPTKAGLHKEFEQVIKTIDQIQETTIYAAEGPAGTETAAISPELILLPSALAQPPPQNVNDPIWAQKPPTDDKNLYFVGSAGGPTFAQAQQNALVAARNAATEMFTKSAQESASLGNKPQVKDQLIKALTSVAETADTFTAPDAHAGGYRSFALLRISRTAARFAAESIFVQTSVPYDKPFLDRLQKKP